MPAFSSKARPKAQALQARLLVKRSAPVGEFKFPYVPVDPVARLKRAILEKVERERNATFAELAHIEGFAGNLDIVNTTANVLIWMGMSAEAIDAIEQLQRENLIHLAGSSWLVYSWSGGPVPNLPIVKHRPRSGRFQKMHWGPTALVAGPAPWG